MKLWCSDVKYLGYVSGLVSGVHHKLITSIWNKKELPQELKESIIVPTYKKGDKTHCSNCRGISILSIT